MLENVSPLWALVPLGLLWFLSLMRIPYDQCQRLLADADEPKTEREATEEGGTLSTVTTNQCDWCGTQAQEEAGAAYSPGRHPLEGWVIRQGPLTTTGIVGVAPMPMRHFCSQEHEARFLLTQGANHAEQGPHAWPAP